MSRESEQIQILKEQFRKQAKDFSNKKLTMNNEDYLQWMMSGLNLRKEMNVLDVASGTGILSRAISPYVSMVTSIDLSNDMIREGTEQNRLQHITNVQFQTGNAEQLPLEQSQFELVVSRFAFHHLPDPIKVLSEMSRVSSDTVCIIDMISPDDDGLFELYNQYETIRDPSHTFALKETQFIQLFDQCGLIDVSIETIQVDVSVETWLNLSKPPSEVENLIYEKINEEIKSGIPITGMFPFVNQQQELMFCQNWIKIIGKKPTIISPYQ